MRDSEMSNSDDNSDHSSEIKETKEDSKSSDISDTEEQEGQSDGSQDISDTKRTDVEGGVQLPVVEVSGQTGELNDMVEEEEEDEDVILPSNKGAIVALALGLAITAILLVFVGCRLRNVKRRLRRGRPLNSNEADYLVNGMYL